MKLTTLTSILAMKHKVFRAMVLLSAIVLLPSALFAQGKNTYALWTEDNGTLEFLCTDNEYNEGASRSGYTIKKVWSGDAVLNTPADEAPGWSSVRKKIKVVKFDKSFADARPKSIAYWFDNSENGSTAANTLTAIEGIGYLNTSEVTSMSNAFFRCAVLETLDLGGFNTSKVVDMSRMFMGCTALKRLDLSGFNTGSVTDMNNMFAYCSALATLDLSGFDTKNVTDMSSMFYGCKNLSAIDLSGFDTKSATTFANMFYGCASIRELDLTNFTSDNVTTAANMFASCSALATIRAAEDADWRNITNISNMFSGCTKLLAVSIDGTSCKYESGKNLPFVCSNGEGYFTSIAGYMITYVGYNTSDLAYQMVDKDVATVKLKKNEFTDPNDSKVFGSWNTEKDGSGTSYDDGESIEVTSNMILYSQWGKDISLCDITINPQSYTFSGSECKPTAIVEDNFGALTLDTDYKVTYTNNINSGTATITIRGVKNYAGTITKTFTIKPANISVATITPQRQVLAFTGEAQAPTYVLRNGDIKLVEGVDYEISGLDGNSNVGDYTVTFTGKGNYTGTATVIYTISAQKAYAVWTVDNATLTFLMAEDAPVVGEDFNGSPVTAVWTGDDVLNSPKDNNPAWNLTVCDKVKIVNFDASFAEASPKSIAYWFNNSNYEGASAQTLVQIKNIKNLNTSAVTSMRGAFYNCSALTLIDVSKFNTDLVTDMSYMFYNCFKVAKIDVSGFYTESCTDMSYMFSGCVKVTKLATDNFDTKNVTTMKDMFVDCTTLTEAAVSGFNTENVTNMERMFNGCDNLKTVDVSKFNTAKVLDFSGMFGGCLSLTALNVAGFETGNAVDFRSMFAGCTKLASLDVSKFNTSSASVFSFMFFDCKSLTSLNVSGFTTDKATEFWGMFEGCKNLTKIDVSNFETGNVTNFSLMFNDCASLKELNVGNFDMSSATSISKMFAGCTSLTTIRAKEDTDWSSVAIANDVFAGSNALVGVGADGSVCKYEDGKVAANTCKDGNGYFTPDNIFVITFNDNLDNKLAYQVVQQPVVEKVNLKANQFTSDVYDFVSWNTAADGSDVTYKNEGEINVGSDITLYAQWGRDIALCEAYSKVEPYSYAYTGDKLYVTDRGGRIIIKDGDKTLTSDVDYTINYPDDNINVGKYEIVVTGKGIYAGSFNLEYEIAPYDLSDVSIEPENAVFVYNGEAQCPDFVLTDGNGNTLEKDVDYKLLTDVSANIDGEEYMVEMEGLGNYAGTNYAFYSIKSAYVVWTETNSTLSFILDDIIYKPGTSYVDGHKATKVWSGDAITKSPVDGKPAWSEILGSLVTVNFKESFVNVSPSSTAYWFAGADKLTTILYLDKLNTSEVTSMSNMFAGCKSLKAIDLSNFNTGNVTDMSKMFEGCASVEELNVKSFNTAKVTKMDGMFANCTALHTILANATDNWAKTNPSMSGMFASDKALVGIGTDNTFCKYADGEDYPNVCRSGKGYFTADNIHIITFDDNNGGAQTFQSVSSVSVVPVKLNANEFNNPGYLFVNWNTEPDGLGTSYDDEEEARFNENTTLYAMWKKDIAACSYAFEPASSTFTGEEITPKLILTDGDYTLKENTDYVLEGYSNNIHAGNATASVRGRGEYAGKATFGFYISPRNLKEVAVAVKSASTSLEYNKSAQSPEYALVFGTIQLVEGNDYTMSSIENNIEVGEYTVTFTGKGDYTGEASSSYEITPRDIAIATVDDIADQEYSGSAIEPAISVKDGSDALTADKDYTVVFTNNINAGTANVKVNGIGNYKGSIESATFKIVPLDLAKVEVSPKNAELPYNRGPQNPDFVLSVNGINLTANTDYTVSGDLAKTDVADDYTVKFTAVEPGNFTGETSVKYSITKLSLENYAEVVFDGGKTNFKKTGELIKPVVSIVDEYGNTLVENTDYTLNNPGNTEIGSYDITATGIGNYTGTITGNYRIVDKSLEDATIEITDGPFVYDGTEKKPGVKVLNGETELVAGTDFTVEYINNVNASDKAEVVLNGLGKYEYSSNKAYFTIEPRSIIDNVAAVLDDDNELVYNGEAQLAKFNLKDGDIILTEDDYTVGDYSKNIEAGIYTITFTGKGNYTGSISGNYEIKGCNIEDATVTTDELEKVYTGEAQTVNLTVKVGDKLLVFGTDYNVNYEDALNVGTATATVEGIGNYAGQSKNTVQFKIVPMPIANVTFEPKNGKWSVGYTGEPIFPAVVAKDKYGNTLEEGKDYTVGDYSNNIEVGDGYTVVFTGKGNYTDAVSTTYKITERSIEDVEIVFVDGVEEYTYTGAEIKPVEKIIDLGKTLVEGVDYILSYNSNKEPGTAVITITGRGKYQGGQKIANFTIKKIEMEDVTIAMSANSFEYNKNAQAPTFTLTDKNGYTLVSGTDFTMSGAEGNVNADEYTVTFAAVEDGHYNGEATAKYTITPVAVDIDKVTIKFSATEFTYNGEPQLPEITVSYGDDVLKLVEDYEMGYGDNVNAGDVYVDVVGKNNYAGFQVRSDKFVINPYPLADNMVQLAAGSSSEYIYNRHAQAPVLVVNGVDGNALTSGTDFEATSTAYNVDANDYTITFTGKGNYTGTAKFDYVIKPYDISGDNSVVEFKDGITEFDYDGTRITPDFTVTAAGHTLEAETEYTVSGETSGINAKKYTIVITGIGNYTNTQNASFRIKPRNIDGTAAIMFNDGDQYIETGSEIKPEITVSDGANDLADTDYEVAYSNNVTPGTATIEVTGVGNYDGFHKSVEFTILPKQPVIEFNVEEGADVVYGNSRVAKDIKAQVADVYMGTITYNYANDELLVPGKYTIEATYTPSDNTSVAADAKITVNVEKRALVINGVEVETSKTYDGNKTANVTKQPTEITNVINGDEVSVSASAEYETQKTGKQKIVITYALSGKDADKYIAYNTTVDGEILKEEIKATVNWVMERQSALNYMSSPEQSDHVHFCAGDKIEVSCTATGMPLAYTIHFAGEEQVDDIHGEYPGDGQSIEIEIPKGLKYGKYSISLVLENSDAETKSEPFAAEFYLDASSDRNDENAVVKQKWDDVVYVANPRNEFVTYQWYRDNKPLTGETGQYYQEKDGLLSVLYAVKIGKSDGDVVFSCPFTATASLKKSVEVASVKVYPNPAVANQDFTVEIQNAENVDGAITLAIYNGNGTMVKRIDNASTITHISLPAGQYTGAAIVDGKRMTFKVIVY